ncbi:hypothetical protein [uncultured Campylobacter sp.]|uniref:hypothetical protein n=1 Tax=uncultured Campylobacter sp. TaxID=218934 RepID=UPI002628F47B|nr:hypothetical protein [uncultured Campylobacter sp.]
MSNIIVPQENVTEQRMNYDFERIKSYLKDLKDYGYVEKVDETVPLKHDKVMQFGRFRVRLDTKYKIFETDVWQD